MLTSKRAFHIAVRNAGIVIDRTMGNKAQLFIKRQCMGLRPKPGPRDAGLRARNVQTRPDDRGTQTFAAHLFQHANPPNLGHVIRQQKARAPNGCTVNACQKMQRRTVTPVDFVGHADVLFFGKYRPTQGMARRKIIRQ